MCIYNNSVVIIVKIIFIRSILFYCLLDNHSFKTNPNTVTNLSKLFNYIAPASLFDTFLGDEIGKIVEDHVDGKEKLNVMLAKKKRSSLKRMQTRLLLRKNKAQIKVAQRSGVLRKIKIFEGLTPDQLAKFIRMTKLETLKKGDGEYLSEESEHRVMEAL